MVMAVRIKRRIGGAAGPPPALLVGEPAYNDAGDTLHIGDGSGIKLLVGAERQVETFGNQTITGVKTIDVGNFKLTGGVGGHVLLTDGAGNITWGPSPNAPSFTEPPLGGNGTFSAPLIVIPANALQISGGIDNTFPVTSVTLRSVIGGDLPALLTNNKAGIIPAINELVSRLSTVTTGAIQLVGFYDAATDTVSPGVGSPLTPGPLPPALPTTRGYYLIVNTAGDGIGNAPAVTMAMGDWLLSTGTEWLHFAMNFGVIAATNVSLIAVSGLTASNVQDAIEEIWVEVEALLAWKGPTVEISATLPATPDEGDLWWDTVSAKLFLWDGAQWVIVVNTPDGGDGSATDALLRTGGTMTGPLYLADDPVDPMEPVTLRYFEDNLPPGVGLIDGGTF